jgi:hypothetical protein
MSKHNFWGVLDVSRIKIGDFFIFYLQQQWIYYHRWVNFLYDTPRALEDERVFFGGQLENQKNYLESKENFLFSTCTLKTTVATCRGQNVGAVEQIYEICYLFCYLFENFGKDLVVWKSRNTCPKAFKFFLVWKQHLRSEI